MGKWEKIKKKYYKKNHVLQYEGGYIDFGFDSMKTVKNGVFQTYEEYLDIQMKSCGKSRGYLGQFYYSDVVNCNIKGRIEHFDKKNGKVVFERIVIYAIDSEGIGRFGTEDHVWMDAEPFKSYVEGDCLEFTAEIGRYMKTTNGKIIDYGLDNPKCISKIEPYEKPTEEDLTYQTIDDIICETCLYHDWCYFRNCIADEREREEKRRILYELWEKIMLFFV